MVIHRHQWVEHPVWGRGQVEWSVQEGTVDARVRFGHGSEMANVCDLAPFPFLGPRWSFTFFLKGAHVGVRVRSGTPGSRAVLGELLMTVDEAAEFRLALGNVGAVIELEYVDDGRNG